ncbi:MAG: 50S ribosomal protein L5 [Candidatus Pacebacteria bacterium]|nr:50S ribosomal protein L5 [Candidatus Paceibacterota bacterium]
MNRLKQKFQQEVVPALQKEFAHSNVFAVGKIQKVVINMGIKDPADPKARLKVIENVVDQFTVISGQKPQITKARKSVANFKLRAGDPLGVSVTLRGQRMWEFLDKLISIALPRVKDFRGISRTAFDGQGNYSLGIEEQIVFPEIEYDKIESIRSLQINFVTSTKNDKEAFRMLELMGLPFEKEEDNK